MKPLIPFVALLALMLAACDAKRSSAPHPEAADASGNAVDDPAALPPPDPRDEEVPPATAPASGQMPADETASEGFPRRVLITNDNGFEDEKIHALAKAFAAAGIDTWVVAASTDRSGASNWLEATRTGNYRVRTVSIGPKIKGYMLQGTPADCVVFALSGPMKNTPPDLVVSGINGGANQADDWFGSGTIGAVRTGTYFGVPGVAVSGLLSDDESDHRRVAEWVVSFARSEPVRRLEPPQYFTVSLPEGPITDITGVEVVRRARGLIRGAAEATVTEEGWDVWSLRVESTDLEAAPDTDVAALERKHIAIIPMHVDEMDETAHRALSARDVPAWPALPAPPELPDENVPPATAPVSGQMPAAGTIGFDGFGPAAFGSNQEEVRIAWGRDLGDATPSEPGGCYYLMPQPLPADGYRIAFMIEGDRFSRIDVRADDITAPGGGRVGMSADRIDELYGDRVEKRPHKYVEGGSYLRISDDAGGEGVLLFETDAEGRVTTWRIGVPPQVDYVEGCS